MTGVADPRLLRASHIKPWAKCDTDAERLDVYIGLLLAAQYNASPASRWPTDLAALDVTVAA